MGSKARIHSILSFTNSDDKTARLVNYFIFSVIIINVCAVILESVEMLAKEYQSVFHWIELVSVVIFTIEYVVRVTVCTVDQRYRHPFLGRLSFTFTPMALIDLLAVLPFYLPLLIGLDLRFIRLLRLVRIFRVLKLSRYNAAMYSLAQVLREKREQLTLCLFSVGTLIVLSSSLLYYVEREAQPDVFSSIPATMWWAVATLTTVGYGDIYPITGLGKLMAGLLAIFGLGLFALPAGIIAGGFAEQLEGKTTFVCPHCGKDVSTYQS